MVDIQQLFEPKSSTYTYILRDQDLKDAVIIDPVDVDVPRYLQELQGFNLRFILDTHIHADHITAAYQLKQHTRAGYGLGAMLEGVDLLLREGLYINVCGVDIHVITTPGHTPESVCFLVGNYLFTGDTLLIGKCGRTDFQGGSAADLYNSITQKLFTLPNETIVYPGHEYEKRTHSTIGWEKEHNVRLVHKTKDQFIQIMANLNLTKPAVMDLVVAANKNCGRQ